MAVLVGQRVVHCRFEPQMAVIPALWIVSLGRGLNLLADTLREQSLKD